MLTPPHRLNKSRAQRILWLLEELNVPYDVEIYHREPLEAPESLRKVHPLGKSPVITVQPAGSATPITLAESGFITSYLASHFTTPSRPLLPRKWKPGKEDTLGGETDAWLRHEYLLHYAEGSLMPLVVTKLILDLFNSDRVPFFVRPVAGLVARKVINAYIFPNAKKHLAFLEGMLEDAPTDGGEEGGAKEGGYLCGNRLTAADILMGFPILTAKDRFKDAGAWKPSLEGEFPKVWAYLERLENEEGYKRSVKKIEELDGKFSAL